MATEIAKLLKCRERIRKAKPWIFNVIVGIWTVTIIIQIFTPTSLNPAPMTACAFAATLLALYASTASKLNLELVERVMELESRLDLVEQSKSEQHAAPLPSEGAPSEGR